MCLIFAGGYEVTDRKKHERNERGRQTARWASELIRFLSTCICPMLTTAILIHHQHHPSCSSTAIPSFTFHTNISQIQHDSPLSHTIPSSSPSPLQRLVQETKEKTEKTQVSIKPVPARSMLCMYAKPKPGPNHTPKNLFCRASRAQTTKEISKPNIKRKRNCN